MKRRPETSTLPTSADKSIPVSESLVDAMVPSEPDESSTISLPSQELLSETPVSEEQETLKRVPVPTPARERKAIIPTTEEDVKRNRIEAIKNKAIKTRNEALEKLHATLVSAEQQANEGAPRDLVPKVLQNLNEQAKQLEELFEGITKEIRDSTDDEEQEQLREQKNALQEGITELIAVRNRIRERLPRKTPKEDVGYEPEKDILQRIRAELKKDTLTANMRQREASLLQERAQQLEQQPSSKGQQRILEEIRGLINYLRRPDELHTAMPEPVADNRLKEQLEKAAQRVQAQYGRHPEDIIKEGAGMGFHLTRNAANALRGLMNQRPDPLQEWEILKERLGRQQRGETTPEEAPVSDAVASSKRRRKTAA